MIKFHAFFLAAICLVMPAPAADWDTKDMRLTDYQSLPHLRVNTSIGLCYRFGSVSTDLNNDLQSYIYGLRVGRNLSADAAYFFSEYFGAGIDYSYFTASNYLESAVVSDPETGRLMGMGVMQDEIGLHAVGPAFLFGYLVGSGNMFLLLSLAPVKLIYGDKQLLMDKTFDIEGSTWGLHSRIAFDYRILQFLGLGIDVAHLYSPSVKLTVNGVSGAVKDKEPLGSMTYSVGLKFYL